MNRLRAAAPAAVVLGLAMAGTAPAPSTAQGARPPRLTVTAVANPVPDALLGVSFPDPMHGYVVGVDHVAYSTVDGGQTWSVMRTPLPSLAADGRRREAGPNAVESPKFTDVDFVDTQRGLAVSTGDAILSTADGGRTWTKVRLPKPVEVRPDWPDVVPSFWQFNAVSFVDPENATAVGEVGAIFRTTDGGATWTYTGDPAHGTLTDVDFVDSFHGHIAGTVRSRTVTGGSYLVLATLDGGVTWTPQRSQRPDEEDDPINLQAVAYAGEPRRVTAVGYSGRIFVSFDLGATWRGRRSGTEERLQAVAFADRQRGLAVGYVPFPDRTAGQILATNDGGQSWHPRPTPEGDFLTDVAFADATTAYVVGCQSSAVPCPQGSILRVDFPELELDPGQPSSSGLSPVPFVLLGLAVLVILGGVQLARRLS